jgi:branched-chain amino acid transport system permease protein
MDWQIAGILAQDGLTWGAVYALLALALVLVFSVTRAIFIPQGEFVSFGALTLAAIQNGAVPQLTWLVLAMGALVFVMDALATWRMSGNRLGAKPYLINAASNLALPLALHLLVRHIALAQLPMAAQAGLAILIVTLMGPMIYRIAYQRLSEASTLVLLIVSVAVHLLLTGVGLLLFGAEGSRTAPFTDASFDLGGLTISGASISVVVISLLLIVALYLYFNRTLSGKALRAFMLAAAIGALSGVLIGPMATIFYDSGFLIGLKGFVGAIVGGLVSYPVAAAGAVLVGLLESYSSFWASAFKEVIVFTLIIPVLLWRSLAAGHVEEEH